MRKSQLYTILILKVDYLYVYAIIFIGLGKFYTPENFQLLFAGHPVYKEHNTRVIFHLSDKMRYQRVMCTTEKITFGNEPRFQN